MFNKFTVELLILGDNNYFTCWHTFLFLAFLDFMPDMEGRDLGIMHTIQKHFIDLSTKLQAPPFELLCS